MIFPSRKHSGLMYAFVPAHFDELLILSIDLDRPKSPITNLPSCFTNMFLLLEKKQYYIKYLFYCIVNVFFALTRFDLSFDKLKPFSKLHEAPRMTPDTTLFNKECNIFCAAHSEIVRKNELVKKTINSINSINSF